MKDKILKLKTFLLQNLKWIVLFLCITLFLIILKDVMDKDVMKIDTKGHSIISTYFISDFFTPIAKILTYLGSEYCLIGLSICFLLGIKNRKIGISIILNLILAALTNQTLKQLLQRPRPIEYRLISETGYSFPSGHSMVSMAFYGYLIYLVYHHITNKYVKWSLITLLSLLILGIGASRIYLGVHYTSDVIAGFLVAISYLIILQQIGTSFLVALKRKRGD